MLGYHLVLGGVGIGVGPIHTNHLLSLRIQRIFVDMFVVYSSAHLIGIAVRKLVLLFLVELLLIIWRHFLIVLRVLF